MGNRDWLLVFMFCGVIAVFVMAMILIDTDLDKINDNLALIVEKTG